MLRSAMTTKILLGLVALSRISIGFGRISNAIPSVSRFLDTIRAAWFFLTPAPQTAQTSQSRSTGTLKANILQPEPGPKLSMLHEHQLTDMKATENTKHTTTQALNPNTVNFICQCTQKVIWFYMYACVCVCVYVNRCLCVCMYVRTYVSVLVQLFDPALHHRIGSYRAAKYSLGQKMIDSIA